jgi:hypothetical protein
LKKAFLSRGEQIGQESASPGSSLLSALIRFPLAGAVEGEMRLGIFGSKSRFSRLGWSFVFRIKVSIGLCEAT